MVSIYMPGWVKRRMDLAEAWEVAKTYGMGPSHDMQSLAAHRDVYPAASERDAWNYLLVAERCGAWG